MLRSSRSHAIFSLTLTQKRFTGSGPPPVAAVIASPSRLARPGSTIGFQSARVGSPTFGRLAHAKFSICNDTGTRCFPPPQSSLGHSEDDRLASASSGEWVTIVSKFILWTSQVLSGSNGPQQREIGSKKESQSTADSLLWEMSSPL